MALAPPPLPLLRPLPAASAWTCHLRSAACARIAGPMPALPCCAAAQCKLGAGPHPSLPPPPCVQLCLRHLWLLPAFLHPAGGGRGVHAARGAQGPDHLVPPRGGWVGWRLCSLLVDGSGHCLHQARRAGDRRRAARHLCPRRCDRAVLDRVCGICGGHCGGGPRQVRRPLAHYACLRPASKCVRSVHVRSVQFSWSKQPADSFAATSQPGLLPC